MPFVDTITPVDLTLRGSSLSSPVAAPDMRLRRQYRNEQDTTGGLLRRKAHTAQQHAQSTLHGKPIVAMRAAIRQTTNTAIHEYQRDQQSLVLSLREVEVAIGKGTAHVSPSL